MSGIHCFACGVTFLRAWKKNNEINHAYSQCSGAGGSMIKLPPGRSWSRSRNYELWHRTPVLTVLSKKFAK